MATDLASQRLDRHVLLVGLVVVTGAIGAIIATTTVAIALPALSESLDAPLSSVQWVVAGYLLGLAAAISTTGWLARRVGARRLYVASLAAFMLASLLVVLGAPLLVYGLAEAGRAGSFAEPRALVGIAGGALLLVVFAAHAWFKDHPLLDVRLWTNPAFAACASCAVLASATFYGSLVLLPLYFDIARGESALTTALLLVPQGVGAAASLAVTGRLTDRVGGGRVATVSMGLMLLGTVPFAFATETTSYWPLCVALFVRGIGISGSIMPALAAVYTTLRSDQIPDATPQLNVLQRLGGSLGATLLALALVSESEGTLRLAGGGPARGSDVAAAFADTFVWAIVITAVALVPAAILAYLERHRFAGSAGGRVTAYTSRR